MEKITVLSSLTIFMNVLPDKLSNVPAIARKTSLIQNGMAILLGKFNLHKFD